MNIRLIRKILILASSQIIILVLSLLIYRTISLLSYINISFYVASALLLSALLLFTIHQGFFDIISKSMNFAFSRGRDKRKFNDIPSLSQLITIDQKPLLFYGISIGLLMIIALFFFYI